MSIPRTKFVRLVHDDLLTEDTLKLRQEEPTQDKENSDCQSEQQKDDSQEKQSIS